MMKRKGQAAMEYLMTYGWAILIIVVVVAALYAMGVFKPKASVPYSGFGGDITYVDHTATQLVIRTAKEIHYPSDNTTTYPAGSSIIIDISGTCTSWPSTGCPVTINYKTPEGLVKQVSGTLYKTW